MDAMYLEIIDESILINIHIFYNSFANYYHLNAFFIALSVIISWQLSLLTRRQGGDLQWRQLVEDFCEIRVVLYALPG